LARADRHGARALLVAGGAHTANTIKHPMVHAGGLRARVWRARRDAIWLILPTRARREPWRGPPAGRPGRTFDDLTSFPPVCGFARLLLEAWAWLPCPCPLPHAPAGRLRSLFSSGCSPDTLVCQLLYAHSCLSASQRALQPSLCSALTTPGSGFAPGTPQLANADGMRAITGHGRYPVFAAVASKG